MMTCMDRLELYHYKQLTLNEKINDKQVQREHIYKTMAYDHGFLDEVETFPRPMRTVLNKLTLPNAKQPY